MCGDTFSDQSIFLTLFLCRNCQPPGYVYMKPRFRGGRYMRVDGRLER